MRSDFGLVFTDETVDGGLKVDDGMEDAMLEPAPCVKSAESMPPPKQRPMLMHERAAELCMAKLYEITATEDVDAKTLQAISRSLASTIRTVKEARGQRSDEERRSELSEAADQAGRRGAAPPHLISAMRAVIEIPEEELEEILEERRRKASAGEGDTGTPMDVIHRVRRDIYGLTDE